MARLRRRSISTCGARKSVLSFSTPPSRNTALAAAVASSSTIATAAAAAAAATGCSWSAAVELSQRHGDALAAKENCTPLNASHDRHIRRRIAIERSNRDGCIMVVDTTPGFALCKGRKAAFRDGAFDGFSCSFELFEFCTGKIDGRYGQVPVQVPVREGEGGIRRSKFVPTAGPPPPVTQIIAVKNVIQ